MSDETDMAQVDTLEGLRAALERESYLADRPLAVSLHLSLAMGRPLLLEGEAGVGKTEVAKTLARVLGRELIRLQCYEGIDAAQALYEWDYPRQLLSARLAHDGAVEVSRLYSPDFLIERPLLRAIRLGRRAVLLIDELDRADDEFEAFLLEVLSTWQVTIPELGPIQAATPPVVVLTSNRTRELHDALKRRCLYHWLEHPGIERELEIVRTRAPEVPEALAAQVVRAVHAIRSDHEMLKPPGVAETLDWARALHELGTRTLDTATAAATLGVAVKYREDAERVKKALDVMLTP